MFPLLVMFYYYILIITINMPFYPFIRCLFLFVDAFYANRVNLA